MGLIIGRSFNECCFVVSAIKGLQVKYDTKSRRRAIPTNVGMGGTDVQAFGRAKPLAGAAGSSGWGGWTGGGRGALVFEQRLGAGGDVELLVNAVHIFADGIVANVEFPGNLLVAETFGQQGEGFLFALGESAHLR